MKKKIIAIAGAAALCFSMTTSALAVAPAAPNAGYGFCGGGYSLMWDQSGNFLDSAAFEANLNELIASGQLRAEDKDFFMSRYEWCSTSGGGYTGVRGGGCGGRGMGMYR